MVDKFEKYFCKVATKKWLVNNLAKVKYFRKYA